MARLAWVLVGSIAVLTMSGGTSAEAQEPAAALLSTEEWAQLMNRDHKGGIAYMRGALDTLAAVGNFTCRGAVDLSRVVARIMVDSQSRPEKTQRWFIFALMSDLTRNYQCRFADTDRLKFSNDKLSEWEKER